MKTKCILVSALIGAVLIGACTQEVSEPPAAATGKLTVNLGIEGASAVQGSVNDARTIHPEVNAGNFTRYELSFSGGPATNPVPATIGENSMTLPVGTYTITGMAYTGSGAGEKAVAAGTQGDVEIRAGTNAPVTITLGPKTDAGGTGNFNYRITAPQGAAGTLSITPSRVAPITLTGGSPITGAAALDPGVYQVNVVLEKGGEQAGDSEILHIYSGLDTGTWTLEYEDSDFAATAAPVTGTNDAGLDFNYGAVTITLDPSTGIVAQGETITFSIPEDTGDEVKWYVDGSSTAAGTGYTFALDTTDYAVKGHSVTVTWTKDGKAYGQMGAFTVTTETAGGGPVNTGPVRADDLGAYLSALSSNTPESPHTVKFASINVSLPIWGTTIKEALSASKKYIVLDLSACTANLNTLTGKMGTTPGTTDFNVIWKNNYIVGIILPDTIKTINYAFYEFGSGLKSVTMPSGITTIGDYSFRNCNGITSIVLPENLSSLGVEAFCKCSSLKSVTIPAKVSELKNNTFYNCTSLASLTILKQDGVTTITANTLDNTPSSMEIFVPASLVSAYKAAANWKNYASQIKAMPEG
jgi:hypothetical protein